MAIEVDKLLEESKVRSEARIRNLEDNEEQNRLLRLLDLGNSRQTDR